MLDIVTELRRVQERLRDPNDTVRLSMQTIGVADSGNYACLAGFIFLNNPDVFVPKYEYHLCDLNITHTIMAEFYGVTKEDFETKAIHLPDPLWKVFFLGDDDRLGAIDRIEKCIEELQAA